jgi:cytochrome c oxidase cbb3-type subunit 3
MSRRAARRHVLVALVGLSSAVLTLDSCGRSARNGSPHRAASVDSSFTALAFQRGRSPLAISISSGRPIYGRYCAVCHGETGGGDGFNAYNIKAAYDVNPAAFADSAFMATLEDSVALAAIRGGGPAIGKSSSMPPWGQTLTASELADVWLYVRSLAAASHE